jgi:phosphoesterase RecJ-like protein
MTTRSPDWGRVIEALEGAKSVAIACHVNPDGDALGSLFAAALGLKGLGKAVAPSWGTTPAKVPAQYSFLPGADLLVQPTDIPASDVWLVLDCGDAARLGDLESAAGTAKVLINIDHHRGNTEFGHLNVVLPDASSTAELVHALLLDLGVPIDTPLATNLYVGVVTDTGRFQYQNTSPATLRLAAELLETGVEHTFIAQQVFESAPFGFMKLLGRVLDRAILHESERFVYSFLTRADLEETRVAPEETDKVIDALRSTDAADVAALFKEQEDGAWRVSLRSKGPNVGAFARSHGGGGHDLAAGFTADDIETTVKALLAELAG